MAKTKAVPVPVANAMDLIWNDGVVPAWLLGMTLGFVLLFPILKALFPKTCRKRGAFLLAFELVAAVPLFMCAYYGVTGWFFQVDDFTTKEQRLYDVSPAAVKVLQTNFAFQTWDFAVSFLHKELNSPEMLAHHSIAALLCYWGLTMPYMHYYAIYFFGVSEVSSVPLVVVDICKYYPEFAKRFPTVEFAAKLAFALFFILVRDVFWVYTAVTVWSDGVGVLRQGNNPEKYPAYVTAGVLIANAFFSTLQIVWTGKLLEGAKEVFVKNAKKVK
mmetsp:Transcript_529/g.2061  ORF Transcript_529/g.2061 Transcript_529/m.2061 type:complete len:273 (+) Transcript_529:75-893(+)